jgi:DNA helicase II / ATP-dependent DNA helicase PcrA
VIETENLLTDLTDAQRDAVMQVDGPLLVVAGAGSGKTRVITRRVGYLIGLGVPATSVLAITFTNKAAGEMKQRIGAILDRPIRDFGRLDQPWPIICTFHSLCLRVLKHYASQIGLPGNFTIYDSGDQTRLIKEALKTLELSPTNFPPGSVHSTISNAKNQLVTAEDFARQGGGFHERTVARIYSKYQQLLKQNNALDYDDLLLKTAMVFRQHPQVLAELQERFQYILIDEYQDTNHAQYVIAHALALRHRNICVVGDPDQSIYAWRGADIRNILEFEQDYPDAKVVRLEQNYRSTKTILQVASELIARNSQRKEKTLWTENDQGAKAEVFISSDEHEEARIVAQQLRDLHEKDGVAWSDMAVFYRMNALSRVVEDALRRENLPYQIARGVEFYNRKEIKDVLAYLRVIANPADEVNLMRIVNTPARGLGDTSMKQVQTYAIGNGMSLWEALRRAGQIGGLSTRAVNAAGQFVALVESWRLMMDDHSVRELMEDVVRRSGLEAYLRKIGEKELSELANVSELITSAAEFDAENPEGALEEYLSLVSLVSDVDHLKEGGGAITLMTLHAAKGLEFPVVVMVGLEEGILPHSRARDNLSELEEERRLCFVGITRAQQRLILTRAAWRTIRGLRERTVASQFLGEMPAECLEVSDYSKGGALRGLGRPGFGESSHEDDVKTAGFRRGQMVRHQTFGIGRIAEVSQVGQHTRAVVEFTRVGRKTLVLQYARLEPVG